MVSCCLLNELTPSHSLPAEKKMMTSKIGSRIVILLDQSCLQGQSTLQTRNNETVDELSAQPGLIKAAGDRINVNIITVCYYLFLDQ